MTILLLGANGQVGWELRRSLAPLGPLVACDRGDIDLEDLDRLRSTLRRITPSFVVNAAAYTAVDEAESEPDRAYRINAEAVELLARESKRLNSWLVHYSTDYVFDGEKSTPYREDDKPNPLSVYGKSKLEGERAIQESGCHYLIFRTSWVYAARGHNFIRTILRLAREREELNIVADQFGVPTGAELLADVSTLAIHNLLINKHPLPLGECRVGGGNNRHARDGSFGNDLQSTDRSDIYHLVPSGETSWHGFAQHIIAAAARRGFELRAPPDRVYPIATSEYPTPAKRPARSRLDTQKLRKAFGIFLPAWEEGVERVVGEVVGSGEST